MRCDKNQLKLSHPIFYMPSYAFLLSLWGQRAVCTWTEWTPSPRMLDSHLHSACWGKLLSCTCRWPEERRHLVRSAASSSSTELLRAWRGTRAGRLAMPSETAQRLISYRLLLTHCLSKQQWVRHYWWAATIDLTACSHHHKGHWKGRSRTSNGTSVF